MSRNKNNNDNSRDKSISAIHVHQGIVLVQAPSKKDLDALLSRAMFKKALLRKIDESSALFEGSLQESIFEYFEKKNLQHVIMNTGFEKVPVSISGPE
ncbi:MAG: hypothetical protein GXP49_03465 [Deltaproteobacteria bacterium]|nr:hypothetical protein [Deltaproteobacteria bacterium]